MSEAARIVWLDAATTLQVLDGDAAVLDAVLEMLAHDLAVKLPVVEALWSDPHRGELGAQLHTLKGVCSTAGATELARRCEAAEVRLKNSELRQADLDGLIEASQMTIAAIGRYRRSHPVLDTNTA